MFSHTDFWSQRGSADPPERAGCAPGHRSSTDRTLSGHQPLRPTDPTQRHEGTSTARISAGSPDSGPAAYYHHQPKNKPATMALLGGRPSSRVQEFVCEHSTTS